MEELKRHGGVDRLRKALVWDDEEAVDIAASVIASCSGYTARGPGTRTQTFGEHSIAVHETDYVEGGLGWRVWASGVVMCRELIARHREIGLHGADVLEVGAGCGVVGFLAARLGARRVTFTDYLPGLLSNLDRSVELNAEACDGCELRVAHLEWLSAVPGLSEEAREAGRRRRELLGGRRQCLRVHRRGSAAAGRRDLPGDTGQRRVLRGPAAGSVGAHAV